VFLARHPRAASTKSADLGEQRLRLVVGDQASPDLGRDR
jgi:hypothetical protein